MFDVHANVLCIQTNNFKVVAIISGGDGGRREGYRTLSNTQQTTCTMHVQNV